MSWLENDAVALSDLKQHYLFTVLSDQQFAALKTHSRIITLAESAHLFHFGDHATHFYLLREGQIQLYRLLANGEEKVIEIIHPGETFAEAVMFLQGRCYPVSAKAVRPSTLWAIDMARYREILRISPELCLQLLGSMSRRLHGAIQDIERLSVHNALVRLVHLLLQAAPDRTVQSYIVDWETPKQILASRLSVRPETFSRLLQQLSRQGLISVQGKTVHVLDATELRHILSETVG